MDLRRLAPRLLAASAMIAVVLWAMRPAAQRPTSPPSDPPLPAVQLATVATESVSAEHVFRGVVRAGQRAVLSFALGGRMDTRLVQVGDRVTEGQLLARLDASPYNNASRASRASQRELALRAEQLQRDRARIGHLAEGGVATTSSLEQVESGYARVQAMQAAANADVSESRRRLRETALRAPFDGVVTDVLVQAGELVAAGTPVIRLVGEGGREVEIMVPASVATQIAEGDRAQVQGAGVHRGPETTAVIRSVQDAAANRFGLFPVVLALDGTIGAGVGVAVHLRTAPEEAIWVPLDAILDPSGQRPFVWVIESGRAARREVRLGALEGSRVRVVDGLVDGDVLTTGGHHRLLEGDSVRGQRRTVQGEAPSEDATQDNTALEDTVQEDAR